MHTLPIGFVSWFLRFELRFVVTDYPDLTWHLISSVSEEFFYKHMKQIFIILKNITQLVELMDGLGQDKIEDDGLPTSSPEPLQKINAA